MKECVHVRVTGSSSARDLIVSIIPSRDASTAVARLTADWVTRRGGLEPPSVTSREGSISYLGLEGTWVHEALYGVRTRREVCAGLGARCTRSRAQSAVRGGRTVTRLLSRSESR